MDKFLEKFTALSNSELLRITTNSKDYKPEAFQFAMKILESRQLTDEDLNKAKVELDTFIKEENIQNLRRENIENKVNKIVTLIFGRFNPFQSGISTTERIIRTITILMVLLFLIQFYLDFPSLCLFFTDSAGHFHLFWDNSLLYVLLPHILFLMAIVLFFLKKGIGWILLTIVITYSVITYLTFVFTFTLIYPRILCIVKALIGAGFLAFICNGNLRRIYSISDRKMYITLGTVSTILITLVLYIKFFI